QIIAYEIITAIEMWESRIAIQEINFIESEMEKEEGLVRIEILYEIISSGEISSMYIDYDKNGRLINVSE
nr:hypothetical protein [Prolixibacteraceae bacterium]